MAQNRTRLIAVVVAGLAIVATLVLAGGSVFADAAGRDSDNPITGDALQQASAAALAHTGQGRVTDTEVDDEDGYYEVEVTLDDGSQVDVHLDENFNVLGQEADEGEEANDEGEEADEGDDANEAAEDAAEGPDVPITGDALERASAAALEYTGEGRVTGTEVGDEDSYYEVEVTLDNGSQVDVQLDESFNVVSQKVDHEGEGD